MNDVKRGPVRPVDTGFGVELRAWKLRIVEWLGLDPGEVLDVEWNDRSPMAWPIKVTMLVEAKSRATRGMNDGSFYPGDDSTVTRVVRLTEDEHAELRKHAGLMPDYLSWCAEAKRADLRDRFDKVLNEHYFFALEPARCHGCGTRLPCEGEPQDEHRAHVVDLLLEEVDR